MAGPVIQTSAIPQQSAWFLQRGSGTTNTDPQTQVDGPAMNAYVAVTSDTTALPTNSIGIIMDATGAMRATLVGGTQVTFTSGMLAAGVVHPLCLSQIWATGTGTQHIMVLY
jgi:hypothetical protein